MSYATFPLTPEFSYVEAHTYATIKTPFETGVVQTRAKWAKARRMFRLQWHHATEDEAEQLKGFARDVLGAATPFYYTTPDKLARPVVAPTMGQTSGGSLPERTRYAKFVWANGALLTTASVNSGVLTVASSYRLTVTVPSFPANVTTAYVYVGTTEGQEKLQSTGISTSGGTWTEPLTGYDAGGASLPTSNDLTETVTVHFLEDTIEIAKNSAEYYSMTCEFEEIFD